MSKHKYVFVLSIVLLLTVGCGSIGAAPMPQLSGAVESVASDVMYEPAEAPAASMVRADTSMKSVRG